MVTDARTSEMNIEKPHIDNTLVEDFARLISAFDKIDGFLKSHADSIEAKADAGHRHEMSDIVGLANALVVLEESVDSHTHPLANLEDVDVTGASQGMMLQHLAGKWKAVAAEAQYFAIQAIAGLAANNVQSALAELQSSKAAKGDIDAAVSGLVSAAPGSLNTLNELAAALGDDPNFAATLTTQIAALNTALGGKMPKTGGNFTGHTEWQDGYEARFGNSADMRLRHDGTNSFLNNYTGRLYLVSRVHGGEVEIGGEKSDGVYKPGFVYQDGLYCRFFYDGGEKMRTDASGVTVYGRVHARDRMSVGGNGDGDSFVDYYDDNSNSWRTLGWDDSANAFIGENNSGAFKKVLFEGSAPGLYTGTAQNETNYPIGHIIFVLAARGNKPIRNGTTGIWTGNAGREFRNYSEGVALSGVWRSRGDADDYGRGTGQGFFVAQRVS